MRKLLALFALALLPTIAEAAYVQPDPGGRDGWVIDTVTGDIVARRAGANTMRLASGGTFMPVRIYTTAALLEAAALSDGTVAYAQDTDVTYFRQNGVWVTVTTLATMANGATWTNAVNGTTTLTAGGETEQHVVTANLITLTSDSAATYAITPALALAGDLTLSGGAGAFSCGAANCSFVATDNSATGFDMGAAGATAMLRFDTTNGEEKILLSGAVSRSPAFVETFGEGASKGFGIEKFDGAARVSTALIRHNLYTGNGNVFNFAALGAGQTLAPTMTAAGLNIVGDLTATEGYEFSGGTGNASGRPLIIGTDAAFKTCVTVAVSDASSSSDLHIGFRKIGVTLDAFEDYVEYATIGIEGTANPNTIKLQTELDANLDGTGDGVTTTDTTDTWADAASKVICTLVSGAGVTTYTNGGLAPTSTAAFTFTDGSMVIPFIWSLAGADIDGTDTVVLTHWTTTYQ